MVHAGGIAEMFVCESDREVIVLRNRRGFVRAAVQHGVPLLPVYYFGNSQLLSFGPRCDLAAPARGSLHGCPGLRAACIAVIHSVYHKRNQAVALWCNSMPQGV